MASHSDSLLEKQTLLQRWLRLASDGKLKIYRQINDAAAISELRYWLQLIFSAGIATLGLVLNSPAVIIGAMLISPLMGSIMATGLALAAGDLYLSFKAIFNLAASVSVAVGLSAAVVWLLPFHSETAEILARINPTLLDLGVALFSGLAGSVAVCGAGSGSGVTTLPGVAIAVALMPPLCVVGFGLGIGADSHVIYGAGLLFLTNLVAIVASACLVFLCVGMTSPQIRSEMQSLRAGELLSRLISRTRFSAAFQPGANSAWSIVLLVCLLGAIALPLRTALKQVTDEAIARKAAQTVVSRLVSPNATVSQQVVVASDGIAVRLVTTSTLSPKEIATAEREIEIRSGRTAKLYVQSVASQTQVATLLRQIDQEAQAAPPLESVSPPTPHVKSIDEIRTQTIKRAKPVLESIWPSVAPLEGFEISFTPSQVMMNVRCGGAEKMTAIMVEILERELRDQLQTPDLALHVEQKSLRRRR